MFNRTVVILPTPGVNPFNLQTIPSKKVMIKIKIKNSCQEPD